MEKWEYFTASRGFTERVLHYLEDLAVLRERHYGTKPGFTHQLQVDIKKIEKALVEPKI